MTLDYRLLILALGTFAIGTDSYVVAGILPQLAQSFSTSIPAAGQFVSVYAASYAILTPIMATLTANWPRRRVLLVGLASFVMSNIITVTAPTFGVALAGRALAGLGAAMFTPMAGAVASGLVSPGRRARALAIVLAGASAATALGAPIGTFIATLGDWHTTLWFVATLGTLAAAGVLGWLPVTATGPRITFRERLAPLRDLRAVAMLMTTLLAMFGVFLVYTYISVVFDRATAGNGTALAALMSIWGIGATIGSLKIATLTDRFGNRWTLSVAVAILAADFALLPWTSENLISSGLALAIWGICGWGSVVVLQHRLVGLSQALAPILLALNASAIYLAIGGSSAAGALLIKGMNPHDLPFIGAVLIAAAGLMGEVAFRLSRSGAELRTSAAGSG